MEENFIVLLIGPSGSGKTTLALELERRYSWKSVESYTTRPRRTNEEKGHIFISNDAFNRIPANEMAAYTEYNGYRYCATMDQIEKSQIYVIDPVGAKNFNYSGEKAVLMFYLSVPEKIRMQRMKNRGDSDSMIKDRIHTDQIAFGDEAIRSLCLHKLDGTLQPEVAAEKISCMCEKICRRKL